MRAANGEKTIDRALGDPRLDRQGAAAPARPAPRGWRRRYHDTLVLGLDSDTDETIIDVCRPIILNGISDTATRGDLVDRCINVCLPRISEDARRSEAELKSAFEATQPRIFGGLLQAASQALARLPSVPLNRPPRMADFALWAIAAEPAFGIAAGTFLRAYRDSRDDDADTVLDSSPVPVAILALLSRP